MLSQALGPLVACLVAAAAAAVTRLAAGATVKSTAVGAVTSAIGVAGAVLVAVCAAWQLSARRLGHSGGVGEGPAQRRER